MCLHRIAKTFGDNRFGQYPISLEDFPIKVPSSGLGYKLTYMYSRRFRSNLYFSIDDEDSYIKSGKWYSAKHEFVQTERGYWYPSGFHIFLRLKDAISFMKYSLAISNTIELINYHVPICAGFEKKAILGTYIDIPTVVCKHIQFLYPVGTVHNGRFTPYENRSPHNIE